VVFAFGGWILSAAGAPALVTATLSWLATVNVVRAVFNLLPGPRWTAARSARAGLAAER
jgi:Zn-dependent protease